MDTAFDSCAGQLWRLLKERHNDEACSRLLALAWSVRDAPAVGLELSQEARDRMKEGQSLDDNLVLDAVKNFELTRGAFERQRFALESVVRYLHASADLLAQVVNRALALDIADRDCGLGSAISALSDDSRSALRKALESLRASDEFEYVADACNRLKHRDRIVGAINARVDHLGAIDVLQSIGGFEHDGRPYAAVEPAEIASKAEALRELAAQAVGEIALLLEAMPLAAG